MSSSALHSLHVIKKEEDVPSVRMEMRNLGSRFHSILNNFKFQGESLS